MSKEDQGVVVLHQCKVEVSLVTENIRHYSIPQRQAWKKEDGFKGGRGGREKMNRSSKICECVCACDEGYLSSCITYLLVSHEQ